MHLVSLDNQIVRVGGEAFSFQNGEMIHTEDSSSARSSTSAA